MSTTHGALTQQLKEKLGKKFNPSARYTIIEPGTNNTVGALAAANSNPLRKKVATLADGSVVFEKVWQ
ncbi:hypothetical protein LCGC14_2153210 [marine sediment metagenome]|uniref:Uncharacterized protein n=1 Tax=marine sediment metagenome TaxID=412755 RepID=A0A0F9DV42_9ZZZZ